MARIEILDYESAVAPSSRLLGGSGVPCPEWIFLGADYLKLKHLRGLLAGRLHEKDITLGFHASAEELRSPFVDYLSSCEQGSRGLPLCSGFFERIPFRSRLFQDLCYLHSARRAIEESPASHILVICEDRALAADLGDTLAGMSGHVITNRTPAPGTGLEGRGDRMVTGFLEVIPRASFQILTLFLRSLASRWFLWREDIPGEDPGRCILIHTWVSESTCSLKGYRELYYADLQDHLTRMGRSVILIPHLPQGRSLSLSPFFTCLRALKNSGKRFLPEEYFLGAMDLLTIWKKTVISPPRQGTHRLRDISFGWCVYREDFRDWRRATLVYPLVVRALAGGLGRHGIRPEILVLPHENYSWEKMFIHTLRKLQPSVTITGYLHTTVSKNYLMHQLAPASPGQVYLPDFIVTNGPFTSRFLLSRNYPADRVITGGALRYSSLKARVPPVSRSGSPPPDVILVTLPIDPDESVEMLEKIDEALVEGREITAWCKLHPFLPRERLAGVVSPEVLGRFTFIDEPLDTLLPHMGLLLYATSSSCIDALAMGVPVLKILSERRLDIDPLEEFRGRSPFIYTARTPGEIGTCIRASLGRTYTPAERTELAALVKDIFGDITDDMYRAFTRVKPSTS